MWRRKGEKEEEEEEEEEDEEDEELNHGRKLRVLTRLCTDMKLSS